MERVLILFGLVMAISACASAPEPMSWKKDLDNLPIEPINDRAKINEMYKELDKRRVWSR